MEFVELHDTTDTTEFCPRQHLQACYGLATGKVV